MTTATMDGAKTKGSARRKQKQSRKSGFERWFYRQQFGAKPRKRVYEKLVRLLNTGVTQAAALEILWENASHAGKKPTDVTAVAVAEWSSHTADGKDLAYAMRDWIPEQDYSILNAGARSGNLINAIENVVLLQEKQKQIKSAIIGGVAYPCVIVIAALIFMYVFGAKVVPAFDQVMPKEQWYGFPALMASVSDFVMSGGIWKILASFVGTALVVGWSMPRWTGPIRKRFDKFPPYSLYRLVRGSGFLLSMAILQQAGLKPADVLKQFRKGASPWYRERLDKTLTFVNNGKNIGDALYLSGFNFPDVETVMDLKVFAGMGEFDEILMKIGRTNIEDAVGRIKAQSMLILYVAIVGLGLMFVSIAVGIFELQGMVQSNL